MKVIRKHSGFFHWVGVIAIGISLGVGMQFVQAWTPAPSDPPLGNVAGPITVGPNVQTKTNGGIIASFMGAIKMYSESTVATDIGTTLVTKDYVDAMGGGGGVSSNEAIYKIHSTDKNEYPDCLPGFTRIAGLRGHDAGADCVDGIFARGESCKEAVDKQADCRAVMANGTMLQSVRGAGSFGYHISLVLYTGGDSKYLTATESTQSHHVPKDWGFSFCKENIE